MQLTQMPVLPDTLFVTAEATVPCGGEDAVYGYHFDAKGWRLVLDDHPKGGWGNTKLELSEPDAHGRRLLLINRISVQCASSWMAMAYSVDRVDPPSDAFESLLTSQHRFWLGNDGPEFVLKPDELIIELLDLSVDNGIHNRTQIHRYAFGGKVVQRLDPVAFQPQDFFEERLTQAWSEMQSRSKPETQEWHSVTAGLPVADCPGFRAG